MTKILISGHGYFASGFVSNLELIMGKSADLIFLDFNGVESIDIFSRKMEEKIERLNGNVIVLTDIRGGTPFNVAYNIKARDKLKIFLFAGVNVPVALELMMSDVTNLSEEEIYEKLLKPDLQLTRGNLFVEKNEEDEM